LQNRLKDEQNIGYFRRKRKRQALVWARGRKWILGGILKAHGRRNYAQILSINYHAKQRQFPAMLFPDYSRTIVVLMSDVV
jgi:hypothetical protein